MDDQLSPWEERLRRELDLAVQQVRAPDDLAVAARAAGRRRLRRRRALVAVPAVVAVAGGAVWAGTSAPPPAPAVPAASAPATQDAPSPTPAPESPQAVADPQGVTDPQLPVSADEAAVQRFLQRYEYADAERLGQIWNVDPYEAKIEGGRRLLAGEQITELP